MHCGARASDEFMGGFFNGYNVGVMQAFYTKSRAFVPGYVLTLDKLEERRHGYAFGLYSRRFRDVRGDPVYWRDCCLHWDGFHAGIFRFAMGWEKHHVIMATSNCNGAQPRTGGLRLPALGVISGGDGCCT